MCYGISHISRKLPDPSLVYAVPDLGTVHCDVALPAAAQVSLLREWEDKERTRPPLRAYTYSVRLAPDPMVMPLHGK